MRRAPPEPLLPDPLEELVDELLELVEPPEDV
jgi:hypothetical protein